jgi:type I restriction enzyme S subunit
VSTATNDTLSSELNNCQVSEWQTLSLGECITLSSGSTKPADFTDEPTEATQYPVYGGNGITGWSGRFSESGEKIIIGRVGHYCGAVYYVNAPCWITDNALFTKEIKKDLHLPFLASLLKFLDLSKLRNKGAQPLVSQKPIYALQISLPPLPEQQKIAEILSCWDEGINHLSLIAEKKRLRFKFLLHRLLTGGNQSKDQTKTTLGAVTTLVNGRAFKPSDWSDKGTPIIRIQNLNGSKEFNLYDQKVEERYFVEADTLLFSWSGSRGTSFGPHIWNGPKAILNQHIFKVVVNPEVDQSYLYFVLKLVTESIEQRAHGSAGLVHVTKGELEKTPINLPKHISEQRKIASILDSLQNELSMTSDLTRQLKNQKQALMQKLLTGKIRVQLDVEQTQYREARA